MLLPIQIKHCLVLSCLVYQSGCIGTVRGTKYKKIYIYIGDLTIRQRIYVDVHEIVAENKTSQPFKLNHYYPKSPSSLKEGNLS